MDSGTPMAGNGGMGGSGGSGGSSGTTGGSSATGGSGGAGAGGSGGSAGTGMDPDEDGGVDDVDASTPIELPTDGEELSVCFDDDACNGAELVCTQFGTYQGYCGHECQEAADCDEIGGVEATCDLNDRCVVDCTGGGEGDGECPENMECYDVATSPLSEPTFRCQYPEAKSGDVYELCDFNRGDSDCKEDLTCQMFPGPSDQRDAVCSAGCMEAADCEDYGSDATPVCEGAPISPLDGICALECDVDAEENQCPLDMTCLQVAPFTYRCGHEI